MLCQLFKSFQCVRRRKTKLPRIERLARTLVDARLKKIFCKSASANKLYRNIYNKIKISPNKKISFSSWLLSFFLDPNQKVTFCVKIRKDSFLLKLKILFSEEILNLTHRHSKNIIFKPTVSLLPQTGLTSLNCLLYL